MNRIKVIGRLLKTQGGYCQYDLDTYKEMNECFIDLDKVCYIGPMFVRIDNKNSHKYREIMLDNGQFMLVDSDTLQEWLDNER